MIPVDYAWGLDSRAARVASLSVCDLDTFVKAGFWNTRLHYGAVNDTEVFVCQDSRFIYVVPRGTEVGDEFSWRDVRTDLKFRRVELDSGLRVHRGFLHAWEEVADEVYEDVRDRLNDNPTLQVVITGHSLGGAISTLAALWLDFCTPYLITFGQPRVGGDEFNYMVRREVKCWRRYVHRGDLITHVPFALGYRHGGDMFYIGKERIMMNPGWWQVYGQNALRFMRRALDHSMDKYRHRIASAKVFSDQLWVGEER